jgi:hypothetical protein
VKPQTVHLLLLSIFWVVPIAIGSFFLVTGMRSHSELSALPELIGVACLLGGTGYAALTSMFVWKWGTSPKRVFVVHGALLGLGVLWFLIPRLAFFF